MAFQSAPFFVLLAATLILYFSVPARFQNYVLLCAGWIFYSYANFKYLLLLIAVSAVVYGCAHLMVRIENEAGRKGILAGALALIFANLFIFKYSLFHRLVPFAEVSSSGRLIAPLGVSFYTFMLAGYLIDVFRKKQTPEKNFVKFSLFACFFPIAASGPIERAGSLLGQFSKEHRFDYEVFCCGASRVLWGFFKKFVLAETIGLSVNRVYGNLADYTGPFLLLASLMYSYQLYCDFSGYSDIAIGTAKMMGFTVRENFMRPFAAQNFSDLWRRWHISLTSWFRDYLYFPLGGSRKGELRTYINIMIVFAASGIWHGSTLNFLVWGVLNGVFMVLSRMAAKYRAAHQADRISRAPKLAAFLRIAAVYLMFTACIIFFRAKNMSEAIYVYSNLFTGWKQALRDIGGALQMLKNMNIGRVTMFTMSTGFILTEWIEWCAAKHAQDTGMWFRCRRPAARIALYYVLLIWLALFGVLGSSQFIYFQF